MLPALTPGPGLSSAPTSVLAAAVQSDLVERFSIPVPDRVHRALDDVMILAQVQPTSRLLPPLATIIPYPQGRGQPVGWATPAPALGGI